MRSLALALLFAVLVSCATQPAPPTAEPETAQPVVDVPQEEVTGNLRVTATKLNVRLAPDATSEVIASLRRGEKVGLLRSEGEWDRVKLKNGATGWVSSRHLRAEKGCLADRDFRMVEPPSIAFTDTRSHGVVTVEAEVGASGKITKTRVTGNTTGEAALASIAEKEVRSATFAPPVKNCAAQRFIYVYRKTF